MTQLIFHFCLFNPGILASANTYQMLPSQSIESMPYEGQTKFHGDDVRGMSCGD